MLFPHFPDKTMDIDHGAVKVESRPNRLLHLIRLNCISQSYREKVQDHLRLRISVR